MRARASSLLLVSVVATLASARAGFAITLPEPINVTIKDPAQPSVTMKVTLSPNPPPKAAPVR